MKTMKTDFGLAVMGQVAKIGSFTFHKFPTRDSVPNEFYCTKCT